MWNGYQTMVPTKAHIEAVRQWWKDEEVITSLSDNEREFISSTEEDPLTTFKPVVMFCVKKWLCDQMWIVSSLAVVVWSYQALSKGKEVNILRNFHPSAAELIEAAEFGDLEKSAIFYRRCAEALRHFRHHNTALEYFSKALVLDPDDWHTMTGMALTYTLQKQYQKTLELDEEIAKKVSEEIKAASEKEVLKLHLHTTLERMGNKLQAAGRSGETV